MGFKLLGESVDAGPFELSMDREGGTGADEECGGKNGTVGINGERALASGGFGKIWMPFTDHCMGADPARIAYSWLTDT
jgi:hypothetical protein